MRSGNHFRMHIRKSATQKSNWETWMTSGQRTEILKETNGNVGSEKPNESRQNRLGSVTTRLTKQKKTSMEGGSKEECNIQTPWKWKKKPMPHYSRTLISTDLQKQTCWITQQKPCRPGECGWVDVPVKMGFLGGEVPNILPFLPNSLWLHPPLVFPIVAVITTSVLYIL